MIEEKSFLYQSIAQSVMDHGVTTMFGLMGDANLFMANHYARHCGTFVPAAFEGGSVLMALAFTQVTGKVGVATVTQGLGLTNCITALTEGAVSRRPMILLCGDTPVTAPFHPQNVDQRELVKTTGAGFEQIQSPQSATRDIANAFYRARAEKRPVVVFIDAGRGEGVIDRLRQLGHEVTEVNFGGKAKRPMFANKRAEMWTNMRDWIKDSGVLPNIPDLKSDLSAPTYTFDAGSRLQLERKEAMRKRGVKSPDLGDALALTFADDVWVDVDIDVPEANERPSNLVTDHEEVEFT